jgi:hypothetical protein
VTTLVSPHLVALALLASFASFAGCGRTSGDGAAPKPSASTPLPSPTPSTSPSGPADADRDAPTPAGAIHHVLGTGQSLASGVGGSPPLSTSQPYDNRMFDTGVLAGGTGLNAFVPLVEQSVETMSTSFASLVTKLARDGGGSHDLLVSVHAVGGAPYRLMKKGTAPYAVTIAQMTAGFAIARARGLAYDVSAITSADGGGDHVDKNTGLAADLAQWQRDFEGDAKALTGQATAVPLFNTQYSSWTEYEPTSPIPLAQLRAHVDNPGKVIVVGPRYAFPYGSDGVHLTNEGYRVMGEYYARAYRRVVVEHGIWEPLRPKTVTRAAAVVTVRFIVPAPPLVLDTTLATNPGNMGFEYADDGPGTPTITSVALTGADTVAITLSAAPTAGNRRIRYAFTGNQGAKAGLQTGAHGNLRDSDTTPSRNGYALYDWCVHFDEAVP